jgi:hypothetical protein
MAITLKKEVIVDRWSMVIKEARGKTEQVYKDTEHFIKKSEAPKVSFERVKVNPGFLQGMLGNERSYVLVVNNALSGYKIYIGVRDYGNNLDCSWYMTYEPGLIARIIGMLFSFLSKGTVVPTLDLFQEQDLRAYATVVHHCFIEAIEKITKDTSQGIDKTTKGFLGLS